MRNRGKINLSPNNDSYRIKALYFAALLEQLPHSKFDKILYPIFYFLIYFLNYSIKITLSPHPIHHKTRLILKN